MKYLPGRVPGTAVQTVVYNYLLDLAADFASSQGGYSVVGHVLLDFADAATSNVNVLRDPGATGFGRL